MNAEKKMGISSLLELVWSRDFLGKRALLIETTIIQSFGRVFEITQISRLETGAYLLLFLLRAICSQNLRKSCICATFFSVQNT